MSLEQQLERIAVALEAIASRGTFPAPAAEEQEAPKVPAAPETVAAPGTTTPPATETPAAPAAPAGSTLTLEECNQKLVEESNRIGDANKIRDEITKIAGAPSISNLDPSRYQELLDNVAKLPSAS